MDMELRFNDGYVLAQEPKFNSNIVRIEDANINTSGFVLWNKGVPLYDASKFTTVYEEGEGFYVLSNDGSVKPEPQPTPQPEPTYTEVTLIADDEEVDVEVVDYQGYGDVTFYAPMSLSADFLSSLTAIKVENEVIDLTDGYTFVSCEEAVAYEENFYHVYYHKYTEQELVNMQVEVNTANIDYVAMIEEIEL